MAINHPTLFPLLRAKNQKGARPRMNRDAVLRIARRALIGAELLSVHERIQLFDDLSEILPSEEAQEAKDTAFFLRQSLQLQNDFLEKLQ